MEKINVQLWSVKDQLNDDFLGTLKALAKMGFTGVEFAGYYDRSAKEMKTILDDFGLAAVSSHVGIGLLEEGLEREIEYLCEVGASFIVCPAAPIETCESAKEFAAKFNLFGEKAKASGLTFGYHNHAFEFAAAEAELPMDVLLANTCPDLVSFQPDVFWVAYAGLDPYAYLEKHLSRCKAVHLKQILDATSKTNVEAHRGSISFGKIRDLTPASTFIYEQEAFSIPVMEAMSQSAEFLRNL